MGVNWRIFARGFGGVYDFTGTAALGRDRRASISASDVLHAQRSSPYAMEPLTHAQAVELQKMRELAAALGRIKNLSPEQRKEILSRQEGFGPMLYQHEVYMERRRLSKRLLWVLAVVNIANLVVIFTPGIREYAAIWQPLVVIGTVVGLELIDLRDDDPLIPVAHQLRTRLKNAADPSARRRKRGQGNG